MVCNFTLIPESRQRHQYHRPNHRVITRVTDLPSSCSLFTTCFATKVRYYTQIRYYFTPVQIKDHKNWKLEILFWNMVLPKNSPVVICDMKSFQTQTHFYTSPRSSNTTFLTKKSEEKHMWWPREPVVMHPSTFRHASVDFLVFLVPHHKQLQFPFRLVPDYYSWFLLTGNLSSFFVWSQITTPVVQTSVTSETFGTNWKPQSFIGENFTSWLNDSWVNPHQGYPRLCVETIQLIFWSCTDLLIRIETYLSDKVHPGSLLRDFSKNLYFFKGFSKVDVIKLP